MLRQRIMSEIGGPLDDGGIASERDPIALFSAWLKEAEAVEPNDPNAMALATLDAQSRPNVRMVLLKGVDHDGFVFYSNRESAKGNELAAHAHAALNFHWKHLRRAVRVRGTVSEVSGAEADAYFATRAKDSQIGAWASAQSRPPNTPPNTRSAKCPGRITGPASASSRSRSNSGATGPFACMTGWSIAVMAWALGAPSGFFRERA
jgi:hypothetical protein